MADIVTIPTPSLGDRSYLVTDGATGFVVDPQRDIDRVLALAANRGIAVTHVFETHIHNDYVTGGLALARATGAAYHVNGADAVAFERDPIADGDVIPVGRSMRVRVIATPGHTFTHLAYALEDASAGERSRCSPAARCCTGRPGGPTCSAPRTRPRWRRRSAGRCGGWRRSCPTRRWSIRRTGSAASARPGLPPAPTARRSAWSGASTRRSPRLRLVHGGHAGRPR